MNNYLNASWTIDIDAHSNHPVGEMSNYIGRTSHVPGFIDKHAFTKRQHVLISPPIGILLGSPSCACMASILAP